MSEWISWNGAYRSCTIRDHQHDQDVGIGMGPLQWYPDQLCSPRDDPQLGHEELSGENTGWLLGECLVGMDPLCSLDECIREEERVSNTAF
jgi:hypothetical protein